MPHVNVGICSRVLSISHLRLLKKLPAIIWFGKLLPLLQNAKLQECISMKAMPKTGRRSENAREPLRIVSFRGQSGLCPSGSRGGGPHASRDVCSIIILEATKLPLDVDFFLTSRLGNWFMDLLMYGMLLWP